VERLAGRAEREARSVSRPASNPLMSVYRVVAYVVGTGLVILIFVGVPLNLGRHPVFPQLAEVLGVVHGFGFIAYLLLTLTIGARYRLNPVYLVLAGVAGTVPFCSFVAEHYLSRWVRAREAAGAEPVSPGRSA
jgi:integral membrane protein